MSSKCRRYAFTLIEVLIVVIIVAVLAATIIPQFVTSSNDTKTSNLNFNLQSIVRSWRCTRTSTWAPTRRPPTAPHSRLRCATRRTRTAPRIPAAARAGRTSRMPSPPTPSTVAQRSPSLAAQPRPRHRLAAAMAGNTIRPPAGSIRTTSNSSSVRHSSADRAIQLNPTQRALFVPVG